LKLKRSLQKKGANVTDKQGVKQKLNVSKYVKVLTGVLEEFSELFDEKLGCYTVSAVELNEHTQPPFCKARPVPFAMQTKVKEAIDKMESNAVIKTVESSTCAAPIAGVRKKNTDEIRICGHFSVTFNACADLVKYPIPKTEDLHTALRGCTVFCVQDMKSAYHQIAVSADAKQFLTIKTLQGL